MSRWKVSKAYGVWHAHEYERNLYKCFPTWAKAMEHAHREAQQSPKTITIEDPTGAVCTLTATINDRNRIHLKAGDDTFTLVRHEWKPLARFLLAASKSQEEA